MRELDHEDEAEIITTILDLAVQVERLEMKFNQDRGTSEAASTKIYQLADMIFTETEIEFLNEIQKLKGVM